MQVHGCEIISEHDAENPEGFRSTVVRNGDVRGPFATIQEAVECARGLSEVGARTASSSLLASSDQTSSNPTSSLTSSSSAEMLPQQ